MKEITFILGGGGAKGYAHIGILAELEERGVSSTNVIGTSIGALVGACYSAGKLSELESEVREIEILDIPKLFSPTLPAGGIFSGKELMRTLESVLAKRDIADLERNFVAVAYDILAGEPFTFESGPVVDAIRASIAIPALFVPFNFQKRVLVDGGIAEPLPIVRASTRWPESRLLAVDLFRDRSTVESGGMTKRGKLSFFDKVQYFLRSKVKSGDVAEKSLGLLEIIEQTLSGNQRALSALEHKICDVFTLAPAVSDIGLLDFHRADEAIERGRVLVRKNERKILEWLKND